jgi:plasmid stability protein
VVELLVTVFYDVVQALKRCAAEHGRRPEAEHRIILDGSFTSPDAPI